MADEDAEIIRDLVEKLIRMNNRMGHQIVALESVCGWLLADNCVRRADPEGAVLELSAMLMGTADAVAHHIGTGEHGEDSSGGTATMERVARIAEKTVRLILAGSGHASLACENRATGT